MWNQLFNVIDISLLCILGNNLPGQQFQYYDTGQPSLSIQRQPNNFDQEVLQAYPQYREGT